MNEEVVQLINRRRRQILVHSIIYYRFDENIVSDAMWTKWAMELADLQRRYPGEAKQCAYADAFTDFDGSTGFNLPLEDEWAVSKALWLLERKNGNEEDCNGYV